MGSDSTEVLKRIQDETQRIRGRLVKEGDKPRAVDSSPRKSLFALLQRTNHDDAVPLYCRPRQRQKWGEAQIAPHTNWGDTFFDLFYVAGAYNLGNVIRLEPTSQGLLYFAACFLPLQIIWVDKVFFDSRFHTSDDVYHRLYEFAILLCLGTAVLHIRPVATMSNPDDSVDMFSFALSVTVATVLSMGRSLEVMIAVVGQDAAKITARRDILFHCIPVILYAAAAIVSGTEYYDNNDPNVSSDYDYNSTEHDDDGHRFLATSESAGDTDQNDIPTYLLLGGAISFILGWSCLVLLYPGDGRHKLVSVPMNITFVTHRWGEWTMLMLGESVLSLLIVDVTENSDYFRTFFCGILSITLLQFLHFRSQPHEPDDHAMRRTKEAGVAFTCLMEIYSAALVVLGTSYKMLLYHYVYEAKEAGSHRLLETPLSRFLAGSDAPMESLAELQQHVAHFFCGSMAVVWLCSDVMLLTHKGLKDNIGRCRFSHAGPHRVVAFTLFVLRLGMIVFIATLGQYLTDPEHLSFVGLVGIIAQVILRFLGEKYFGATLEHDDVAEHESSHLWPNVTRPQVLPSNSKQHYQ